MSVVRISDAIVPEVFGPHMLKETMEKADVFRSGLVVPDAGLAANLAGGGITFQAPVWNDLANTGSKIGSDDPSKIIIPDKINAFKMQSRRQLRTNAWSTMDLVAELAGDDPMKRIVSRVSDFWARDFNRVTIATLNGVINANIANNSGDMVYNAGVGTGGAVPTAAMSATAILEAKQTMGDKSEYVKVLMVHSRVYTNLQLANLITFIPNSRGEIVMPTYLGYQVMISDTLPVVQNGADFIYISYLAAPGILAFAESPPAIPVETERKAAVGNGTGAEELYTRRQFALHPLGHSWKETTVVDQFPSNSELELAGNWERKFPERKQVPFVAIRSKNG